MTLTTDNATAIADAQLGRWLAFVDWIAFDPEAKRMAAEFGAENAADKSNIDSLPKPRRPRRARKPTLARAIAEARKAGATLAGAMLTADGVSLQFGEPADNKPTNELDEWLAKHAH